MSVTLLAGVAVLVASMAATDQNAPAPVKPDPLQAKQLESLREKLSEYLSQQQPGARGPYSNLFPDTQGNVAPRPGDAVAIYQVAHSAPEKTIVCGMTVWHASADVDPRIRVVVPQNSGEFKIQKIVPPVCTGATDTETGAVLTPRRR